jgi:hypothetical protein
MKGADTGVADPDPHLHGYSMHQFRIVESRNRTALFSFEETNSHETNTTPFVQFEIVPMI